MIYTKVCLFALFVSLIHCQDAAAVVESTIETTTKPTTTIKGVTTIDIDILQIATSTMSKEEFSNLTVQEIIATHHNHTNHSRIQIENPIVDSNTASSTFVVGSSNTSLILIVTVFAVSLVVVAAVILIVTITLKRRSSRNSFQINGDVADSTDSVAKQAVVSNSNKPSDGDNSGTPNGTTVDSALTTATSTEQQQQHVTNNGCCDNGHENMVSTVDETKAQPSAQQQQQESSTNIVSSSSDQIPNAKETDKLLSEQHQQQLIQNHDQSNN